MGLDPTAVPNKTTVPNRFSCIGLKPQPTFIVAASGNLPTTTPNKLSEKRQKCPISAEFNNKLSGKPTISLISAEFSNKLSGNWGIIMATIIGRQAELKILNKLYLSNKAELLALYGRRRVGKTFLISEYFKDKGIYFELTGIKNAKLPEQLRNFAIEMADLFDNGQISEIQKSWQMAFAQLRHKIDKLNNNKRIILFFDELPWLSSQKSGFLPALDHFWNRYASRNKQILMIICGSAASWMIKNIIQDKGGLHGRVTRELRILPFTLTETESYLKSNNIELDRKQIIDIYMAIGGIPKYLSYIEKGKSAAQIINELCFNNQAPLLKEFNKLYSSLFDGAERHIAIIRALAKKPSGLEKDELLKKVGLSSGGTASKIINELEESGFIAYIPTFDKSKSDDKYKLIDEYSLFYITWIAPAPRIGFRSSDKDYWIKKHTSSSWASWSGYAFENICLKHIDRIKEALGLAAVSTSESTWTYKPSAKRQSTGAQIDLLIDRADSCINICEIKYLNKEFTVTKQYAETLRNKKVTLQEQTSSKKSIFITLITTYGTMENSAYLSVIDNQLTIDNLF